MPRVARAAAFASFLAPLGMVARAHPGNLVGSGCHSITESGRYYGHRDAKPNRDARALIKKSRENVRRGKSSPNYSTSFGS